jgi:uncharacterized membrane protein YhaH (DUF805 family)
VVVMVMVMVIVMVMDNKSNRYGNN